MARALSSLKRVLSPQFAENMQPASKRLIKLAEIDPIPCVLARLRLFMDRHPGLVAFSAISFEIVAKIDQSDKSVTQSESKSAT